jgi:riboflavin synthase
MFTGIIEAMGTVAACDPGAEVHRIHIETPEDFLDGVRIGDSIAVDGACLTVVKLHPRGFEVDIIGTTISRTVAGRYAPGDRVNLERALAFGARLDGHLVQGHVDGVGQLHEVQEDGEFWRMTFRIPSEIHRSTILNGSITLNGVSLTVHVLEEPDLVGIGIIPHTWTHTNLSALQPGDPVNVEGDLLGKYVRRLMNA